MEIGKVTDNRLKKLFEPKKTIKSSFIEKPLFSIKGNKLSLDLDMDLHITEDDKINYHHELDKLCNIPTHM